MGRGLSDLPRWILMRAAKQPRLVYAEILADYFGLPRQGRLPAQRVKEGELAGCLMYASGEQRDFDRQAIGETKCRSTVSALSRACRRLQDRGLVKHVRGIARWSGVEIGPKGREWLSVNEAQSLRLVNR
jgi:hypothetical protein